MRVPQDAGMPVDLKRMNRWIQRFEGFRIPITHAHIEGWLSQFDLPDIDLAARVLDAVDFVPPQQVAAAYRIALESFPGWSAAKKERQGKWRFAAYSSSAGESGDAMLHMFRHANNLASRASADMFILRSELLTSGIGPGDKVVFVDDFSGTGKQIVNAWPTFAELLPDGVDAKLVLATATDSALARIEAETDLAVYAHKHLKSSDGLFDPACKHFTPEEKARIREYCGRCEPKSTKEYSGAGLTIVFGHTAPNNSLPILHARSASWEGLFCRYDLGAF